MHAPFRRWDSARNNAFWVMEHLLGNRATEALVGRTRQRVRQRQHDSLQGTSALLQPVPRIRDIAPEAFIQQYVETGRPVVIEGAATHWGATRNWSPAFFAERYGDEEIRLLQMTAAEIAQGVTPQIETTLADALARLEEGNRAYVRFIPLLMEYPELQQDLDMDWFRARRGPLSPKGNLHLFIGGAGTETGAHAAVSANLFLQVHGRKTWKLYAPNWAPVFKPPVARTMYFTSGLDPDDPDYEAYPGARHLQGYEVTLEPGDVLYNPPFWWHKVVNPTVSIGVGFRWFPLLPCFRASPTLWLLTYMSINPPFWVGARMKLDFTKIYSARNWF